MKKKLADLACAWHRKAASDLAAVGQRGVRANDVAARDGAHRVARGGRGTLHFRLGQ